MAAHAFCREAPDERGGVVALLRLSGLDKIADRIFELLELENDLEEDEEPIALASLKGFGDFLRKERKLQRPIMITLSSDGCLVAEWHYQPNSHLAIKFLDEQLAKFASIAPIRPGATQTLSLNGTAPWIEVVKALAPIRVTRWRTGYARSPTG